MRSHTAILLASATLALSGCNVGPKYAPPKAIAPVATTYPSATAQNPVVADDGSTWKPAAPSDTMLRGKWWEVFGDPELNGLEEQLEQNNQNIRQSFEQFMEARALVREARAELFPTASIGPAFNRSRASSNLTNSSTSTGTGATTGTTSGTTGTTGTVVTSTGKQSTLWEAPLDISWEPDLWGRIRNTIREDQYTAQVSAADLENERLTEEAALAEAFFELHGEDALQAVLNSTVDADRESLRITQGLYETGVDDQISVIEAQTTLQSAEALAIAVAAPRAQYEHAIALLIGKPATDFRMPVRGVMASPPPIPIGVPSQLIERRPDVAAAERTMAAANAQIGVATAAFFPQLTLSASGGFESSTFKHWFDWPSRFWSIGPTFSQPIYQAGIRDALHQYAATYNADVAAYQETVLTAFQQVEDYLAETRIYSQQIAKQKEAVASSQKYASLALDRYKTGLDPYLDVITAQNTLLGDQQTLYTTQIQQMTAAVQLVQALGGGWDASELPTPKQVEAKPTAAEVAPAH
ncbi:efflux transporter outer membrane subunit [Acidipila sp. EB88]|nr:efflux transporter outer membrane subunit [Acidipila sp. EB88]